MKLLIFLCVACAAVMAVMISQAVRQEFILKRLKSSTEEKTMQISRYENTVSEMKKTMLGVRPQMMSMITETQNLKTKKETLQKEKTAWEENINTCNKEKGEAEKTKGEVTENLNKLTVQHNEAKGSAQKTIEELKQQILDRDKTMCASVDTTIAEARKLCGLGDA
ncbi:hypothetical protein NL108_001434 [Boleophthalmus pectinirostris]|nr:hypothetical protein NL108_001434 [Boleophthalmus pectinirostris]